VQRNARDATITGMDMTGFNVADPQRAIAFYRDVLGLEPTEMDEDGRGAEFALADGSTFGVWKPDDTSKVPGVEVMFAVADAAAAVKQIRERGGTISDPEETRVCFMAFGRDPDGNAFIIHQRKAR
jgi:predicted enzyme related to lactoylglutathione lyase